MSSLIYIYFYVIGFCFLMICGVNSSDNFDKILWFGLAFDFLLLHE